MDVDVGETGFDTVDVPLGVAQAVSRSCPLAIDEVLEILELLFMSNRQLISLLKTPDQTSFRKATARAESRERTLAAERKEGGERGGPDSLPRSSVAYSTPRPPRPPAGASPGRYCVIVIVSSMNLLWGTTSPWSGAWVST